MDDTAVVARSSSPSSQEEIHRRRKWHCTFVTICVKYYFPVGGHQRWWFMGFFAPLSVAPKQWYTPNNISAFLHVLLFINNNYYTCVHIVVNFRKRWHSLIYHFFNLKGQSNEIFDLWIFFIIRTSLGH